MTDDPQVATDDREDELEDSLTGVEDLDPDLMLNEDEGEDD